MIYASNIDSYKSTMEIHVNNNRIDYHWAYLLNCSLDYTCL